MNQVFKKYNESIRPINDEVLAEKMMGILIENRGRARWVNDYLIGNVCIFRDSSQPGKVIEYVMGSQEDSITTLYQDAQVFQDLSYLKSARRDLILEIASCWGALPSTIMIEDEGRGRKVKLSEMGTAQLIDLLAMYTNICVV